MHRGKGGRSTIEVEYLLTNDDWQPTTDLEVSHLIRLLEKKRKEAEIVVKSAEEEIKLLEAEARAAIESVKRLEAKILPRLHRYVKEQADPASIHETDTLLRYKLARGTITVKKSRKTIARPSDMSRLIEAYPEFVHVKKDFGWGEFKKTLTIEENGTITKDGAKVPEVQAVEIPESVTVEAHFS